MTDPHEHRRENDTLMLTMLHQMRDELRAHMDGEADRLEAIMQRAFPGGDPIGHRSAHEAQMQAVLDRAAFWSKMRFEITKYGLIGLLGWFIYIAWAAFLKGPK